MHLRMEFDSGVGPTCSSEVSQVMLFKGSSSNEAVYVNLLKRTTLNKDDIKSEDILNNKKDVLKK